MKMNKLGLEKLKVLKIGHDDYRTGCRNVSHWETFRLEDDDDHEYEIWRTRVFSRILKI